MDETFGIRIEKSNIINSLKSNNCTNQAVLFQIKKLFHTKEDILFPISVKLFTKYNSYTYQTLAKMFALWRWRGDCRKVNTKIHKQSADILEDEIVISALYYFYF